MNVTIGFFLVVCALVVVLWLMLSYISEMRKTIKELKAQLDFQLDCEAILRKGEVKVNDEEFTEAAKPLIKRWRKKPVVIQAVKWDGSNLAIEALNEVLGLVPLMITDKGELRIPTLEGDMLASVGDWVIKGVCGEFYPCKPDVFEKTYEACADD